MLADHPIVILDEATAESGSSGARALERAATRRWRAARRSSSRTGSRRRRPPTGSSCWRPGAIVEQGTHAELVDAGGPYAALWAAWSDGRT